MLLACSLAVALATNASIAVATDVSVGPTPLAPPTDPFGGERADKGTNVPGVSYPHSAIDQQNILIAKSSRAGLRVASTAVVAMSRSTTYSKTLALSQVAQEQSNWCGPATAYAIMKSLGKTKSAYNSTHTLSQSRLSTSTYTNAGASGGTDWADNEMTQALNRWGGTSWTWYQLTPDPAQPSFMWDYAFMNIDNGRPLAADMVEIAGQKHYNGHPSNRTIFHWTAIYGMYGYSATTGGTLRFADPTGGSAAVNWPNANRYFTMTSSLVIDHMNEGGYTRGIAW